MFGKELIKRQHIHQGQVSIKEFFTFFNSLPNDKILDWSKLKAFEDDKINLKEKFKLVLGKVENIVGKGENAGYQHFPLFLQCFQIPYNSGSLSCDSVVKR